MVHMNTTPDMKFNCIDSAVFIPGTGAMQRSDALHKKQVATVCSGALYKTWCRIREPFIVPEDVTSHSCEGHWEKFDIDKAACRACGKIHLCHSITCESICERGGMVCTITGLCLGQRLVTQFETTPDSICGQYTAATRNKYTHAGQEHPNRPQTSLRRQCIPTHITRMTDHAMQDTDIDAIMRTISNILLSNTTQKSIDNENTKMDAKLRSIALRRLRQYHMTRETPNLCDIEAHLFAKLHGHRLPPPAVAESCVQRLECARRATAAIAQLLQFMRTHCGNVPTCVKHGGVVAGMLYMMRTGVTIDDITVLPRITELKRLLPMEQHLMAFFNIRPKIVTEAENVIKYNMRNIPPHSLALLAQTQCIMRTT